MKKIVIFYSEYIPLIDAIKYQLQETAEVFCFQNFDDCKEINAYDLVVSCHYKGNIDCEYLDSYFSLLPMYQGKNPIKQAIEDGVKVTGITIYYKKNRKILAQYPIFVNNDIHYELLKQKLEYIEQIIYPYVIYKILMNEQFDIQAFMKNGKTCSSNCKECTGCH